MDKVLHTKFGTAKISKEGYYRITSIKEGNFNKRLHRLIFADYWQIGDIDEFFGEKMDIHHIDGNKLNNELNNLEPIPHGEHSSLHKKGENNPVYGQTPWNKGKALSEEHKQKLRDNHATVSGENNPFYGKHHTKSSKQKISDKMKGKNHPKAKYMLWDSTYVQYYKSNMFTTHNPDGSDSRKCFYARYKSKPVPIGGFMEFVSPHIIADLVNGALEE